MTNYLLVNRAIELGGLGIINVNNVAISDIEVCCVNVTAEISVGI